MGDTLGFEALWRAGSLEAAAEVLASAPGSALVARQRARVEFAREAPRRALEALDAALRHAAEADEPGEAALARAHRAEVRQWLGQSAEAMDEARAVLEDRSAPPIARAVASRTLGRVAASARDIEAALNRFDDAIGGLRDTEDASEELAVAHLDAAEALLDRDGPVDSSAAAARLADARDHIDSGKLELLRPRLTLLLARARGATGDPDGAVVELQKLLDSLDDSPRDTRWQTLASIGRLHEQRGAEFLARKSWERAVEVLESLVTALAREHREGFWTDARRQHVRRRAAGETERPLRATFANADPFADGRLARLLEVLKRLASETDLDRLLERITDCAIELSGAERGFVLLTGDDGHLLPHTVRDPANPEDPHIAFSRSIAEAVVIDGEPILTVDARSDHRLNEYVSVHKLMLKSVACLPIRGRSGTVGALYLEHRMRRGRFGDADLDLLLAFADQAAIALENARLLGNLEARREELEVANEELAVAKEEIARLLDAKTVELEEARNDLMRARDALRVANDRHGIVGRSACMRRVFAVIERVRDADVPVVIQGESGTGKELVARAIHFSGRRSRQPFVAVNCAAIPEALLESELFGHVRGAFTGADRDRQGVLARASGGTLFLDEIGDMPAKMQVDLLRVLQDRKVRPVGSDEDIEIDVRVIAASNKSLTALVEDGHFREDLFYRLNVVQLWLPALRERVEDIPLLCDHFLAAFAKRDGVSPRRISREAVRRIAAHPLPGNVRQLEHLLLNAWVMAEGDVIDADDLALAEDGSPLAVPPRLERALGAVTPTPQRADSGEAPPSSLGEFKDVEKLKILEALELHNWNRVRAAKALGMARRTFYRRLKEYEIL